MYSFFFTNTCRKDFKKLSREAQIFIRHSIIPILLKDPLVGEKLRGREYKGFYKFGLRFKSVDYRIIYQIKNKKLTIIFLMIASRENFYGKLRKRV